MTTQTRPLEPHVSSDIFLHIPEKVFQIPDTRIIFFITGNPGLIAYYHPFLSILSTTSPTSSCIIAGFSLGGFEIGSVTDLPAPSGINEIQCPPNAPSGPFYSLEDQIKLTEERVEALAARINEDRDAREQHTDRRNPGGLRVMLIGHSVGAYIALELIRRRAEKRKLRVDPEGKFDITAAILLTPTVVDIAKSSSGRILTPLVTNLPFFPGLISSGGRLLAWSLTEGTLRGLVGRVTGMPAGQDGGTMSALDATVAFLRSEKGVKQALSMASDEMRMMGKDEWGEEVWGVAEKSEGEGRMKLVFYFAKTDHWVADSTREELMKIRGRRMGEGEEWKPRMVVDEEYGLVHGWCIGQSDLVARKVGGWVEEIFTEDSGVKRKD